MAGPHTAALDHWPRELLHNPSVGGTSQRFCVDAATCRLWAAIGSYMENKLSTSAECSGKDYRDGAVVPFELVWMLCVFC